MNFTKEDRKILATDATLFMDMSWQEIVTKLVVDYNELEKELAASRDSRILSAVPSEYEVKEDKFGTWCVFVRGLDKKIAVFGDCGIAEIFSVKEIIERGIAG